LDGEKPERIIADFWKSAMILSHESARIFLEPGVDGCLA